MITFKNACLRRGAQILLKEINWTIYPKQHIGIVGANGTGKSSLMAVLLGKWHVDTGEFTAARSWSLACVEQETPALSISALDFVLDGDKQLREIEHALLAAEKSHDGAAVAALHEKMHAINGYTARSRAAQLLAGLGFSSREQEMLVSEFSGGWRMRLNLAQALMAQSDVLLLDEPTNHLDLDAVLWLESYLQQYQGTLLLISHDRDFLDKTVNHIAYLHQQTLKLYSGNYTAFENQRAAELLLQQAMYERQQKHLAHLQKFIDRFKAKATKAKQAQSRLKAIERMDLVCAVQADSTFQFSFRSPAQCPYPLLTIDDASAGYDDRIILSSVNLTLTPKDRIAILGPNGAGKSTFIKMLAGDIHLKTGIRTAGQGLKIGYFAQHQVDHFDLAATPLLCLQRLSPDEQEVNLRTYLGGFGFIGDRVFEPVKNFSGGEKSRLALALIIWQRPNLLLLDEPTNHLDLDMRQALSIALQEYEGAMILVSHDRYLVRTTTDQLYLLSDGSLKVFDGDLEDYQRWLVDYRKQQLVNSAENESTAISRKEQRQQAAKLRDKRRPFEKRIRDIEKEILSLQQSLSEHEKVLADEFIYEISQKTLLQTTLMQQADDKKKLVDLEDAWLKACEERDGLL